MTDKKKIWLRRALTAIFVFGLIVGAACALINIKVRTTAAEDLKFSITGDGGLSAGALAWLEDFDADCILVLGAGIEDENTPSPM